MKYKSNFATLAEYNLWMNESLYTAAEKLSDEIRKKDKGAFFSSIHGTFNHILWADKAWLARFEKNGFGSEILAQSVRFLSTSDVADYRFESYESFSDLKKERSELDHTIIRWIKDGLSEEKIMQNLQYKNTKGIPCVTPAYEVLTHFFNHQTHHRGQITTLLFQEGVDPGITDLIYFLRVRA
ncbi:damage-inducible protein DinB [Leptospira fletcheri]|uniref:Damage-inducible protein DinB n=1 Tax=Leptospira fletcheri TaxID=2484981 RepID=A0A4V3JD48_9LEPT|nr:DinB family protein [Leptospira fletcheri]TGK08599.1 damage-inducible protein DinB [Leptospira fletcheri]